MRLDFLLALAPLAGLTLPLASADVGVTFGFGIGINVTQAVFRASCSPLVNP